MTASFNWPAFIITPFAPACLLLENVFSGEQCGPWTSCLTCIFCLLQSQGKRVQKGSKDVWADFKEKVRQAAAHNVCADSLWNHQNYTGFKIIQCISINNRNLTSHWHFLFCFIFLSLLIISFLYCKKIIHIYVTTCL